MRKNTDFFLACSAGIFWVGETLFVWPVRVRNIVVAVIFDFMTLEDWGRVEIVTLSFNMALLEQIALSKKTPALQANFFQFLVMKGRGL